jgi:hypothetical protein
MPRVPDAEAFGAPAPPAARAGRPAPARRRPKVERYAAPEVADRWRVR